MRGRNCTLPMVVSILVIPSVTTTSIILCWAIFRSDLWSDVLNIQWAITLTLANMAAVDIILAASFCYLLSSARTGFGPSDTLVVKIMAFTFDTGLLTSICSLAVLLACVLMSSNLVYVGIDLVVTKCTCPPTFSSDTSYSKPCLVYINSFLAMLNTRYYIHANQGPDTPNNHAHQRIDSSNSSDAKPLNVESGCTGEISPSEPIKALLMDCGRDLSFPGPHLDATQSCGRPALIR